MEIQDGYNLHRSLFDVKGAISDPKFQKFFFFQILQNFLHIQRELLCNKLPIQQFSWKQHILGSRDNTLLLGINFRWRKLIQASVSSYKSFKFWIS